jgi:hypothetical protein
VLIGEHLLHSEGVCKEERELACRKSGITVLVRIPFGTWKLVIFVLSCVGRGLAIGQVLV